MSTPVPAPALVAPQVARLEASKLAELLHDSARSRPIIVDVRDPGTSGGFIRDALSVPKVNFESDEFVDAFIKEHTQDELLVFHCLNSNGRGPFCAGRVFDRISEVLKDADAKPEVKILKGGFKVFSEQYGSDENLVDPSDLPL
uniref:Rhodanese domain-containing protein n=1 Tax=Globisporangium ultimum (strain ATCC 200006 / CBS 805.95 / DAOM BR144) TaxID=431595 RepID=K3WVJ0_GLOUD